MPAIITPDSITIFLNVDSTTMIHNATPMLPNHTIHYHSSLVYCVSWEDTDDDHATFIGVRQSLARVCGHGVFEKALKFKQLKAE